MVEACIGFGAMMVPLAVILRVEGEISRWIFYVFVTGGFVCLFLGVILAQIKERIEREKARIEYNKFIAQMAELQSISQGIHDLVKEMRKERNERRTRDTKRKPKNNL